MARDAGAGLPGRAKLANVGVPLVMKKLVDAMTITPTHPQALLVLPLGLLVAYGAAAGHGALHRIARTDVCPRDAARGAHHRAAGVPPSACAVAALPPEPPDRRHDARYRTRHARVSTLVSYTLFNILPTIIEIVLVLGYLSTHYDIWFSLITAGALVLYILFTITVTEWRTHFRRTMNELDSQPIPRHRFAAQLRDGEVFRQRGIRGAL
jgi:ATP-binding cassette subfamily B protein